jgi:hypothetical protein
MKEIIERYLKNLLTQEEKCVFLAQLINDEVLQQEVRLAKMAIMLRTVLSAELIEDESNALINIPLNGDRWNESRKKKFSFFQRWWSIAAAVLLLGAPIQFMVRQRDILLDSTILAAEVKENVILKEPRFKDIASSITCQIQSISLRATPNGGTWSAGRLDGVNFIDYRFQFCPGIQTSLCNSTNDTSTLQWDYGNGLTDLTYENNSYNGCQDTSEIEIMVESDTKPDKDSNEAASLSAYRSFPSEISSKFFKLTKKIHLKSVLPELDTLEIDSNNLSNLNLHAFQRLQKNPFDLKGRYIRGLYYLGSDQYENAKLTFDGLTAILNGVTSNEPWVREDLEWCRLISKLGVRQIDYPDLYRILINKNHKYYPYANLLNQELSYFGVRFTY